jgi:hypothetical protein
MLCSGEAIRRAGPSRIRAGGNEHTATLLSDGSVLIAEE